MEAAIVLVVVAAVVGALLSWRPWLLAGSLYAVSAVAGQHDRLRVARAQRKVEGRTDGAHDR